jgi:hypothetical protein
MPTFRRRTGSNHNTSDGSGRLFFLYISRADFFARWRTPCPNGPAVYESQSNIPKKDSLHGMTIFLFVFPIYSRCRSGISITGRRCSICKPSLPTGLRSSTWSVRQDHVRCRKHSRHLHTDLSSQSHIELPPFEDHRRRRGGG